MAGKSRRPRLILSVEQKEELTRLSHARGSPAREVRRGLCAERPDGLCCAGYALAADNLKLGRTVVADSVNPLILTRDSWRRVAKNADVPCIEIEVICSDAAEHRRRVESRANDIAGHKLPTWQEVLDRRYEPWQGAHIVVDTAKMAVSQALDDILGRLPKPQHQAKLV